MVTLKNIKEAQLAIKDFVHYTPILTSTQLDELMRK